MKQFAAVLLLTMLSFAAIIWARAEPVSEPHASAAEYVYLHQTRARTGALQGLSGPSSLQCAAN